MGGKRRAQMGDLKEGRSIIIDDEPCEVIDYQTSSPGKHGSTKVRISAVGIFDGKKRTMTKPKDSNIEVPVLDNKTGQVISMTENSVQLMDMESYETLDVVMENVNEDIRDDIDEGIEVKYVETLGRVRVESID